MRVLVVGGLGMLGHRVWMELSPVHDVWALVRASKDEVPLLPGIDRSRIIPGTDVTHLDELSAAINTARPEVVINCVGLVRQHQLANNRMLAIQLNALLPHQIAALCRSAGSRFIHVSTDCVFSGQRGMYTEEDIADADDLYGRSKLLGESTSEGSVTIRTSIIGRELRGQLGLVEWFLGSTGVIDGHANAVFSGLTTRALARVFLDHLLPRSDLYGLFHISVEPISKLELLLKLRDAYGLHTEVRPAPLPRLDRSLDSSLFRAKTGFSPPSWRDMIDQLVIGSPSYDEWRSQR